MDEYLNELFDNASAFFAKRPGLLPLLGIALIILNIVLHIFPGNAYWIVSSDLLMHVGIIMSIIGLLLIKPLQ